MNLYVVRVWRVKQSKLAEKLGLANTPDTFLLAVMAESVLQAVSKLRVEYDLDDRWATRQEIEPSGIVQMVDRGTRLL